MRSVPSAIARNSSRLGSWKATGSPGATPSSSSAAATRSEASQQLRPGHLPRLPGRVDLHRGGIVGTRAGVRLQVVEDQACTDVGTRGVTAAGIPIAFMWSRNSG